MYSAKNNRYDGDRFFKGVFPDICLQVTQDSYESCTGFAVTSPEAGPATWLAPSVVSIFDSVFLSVDNGAPVL